MHDPYPDAPSCFVFIRVTTPCSFCARQLLGVAAQYNVMSLRALHRSANPFLVSRPLVAALESLLRLFGVVLVGAGVQNFVPIG